MNVEQRLEDARGRPILKEDGLGLHRFNRFNMVNTTAGQVCSTQSNWPVYIEVIGGQRADQSTAGDHQVNIITNSWTIQTSLVHQY